LTKSSQVSYGGTQYEGYQNWDIVLSPAYLSGIIKSQCIIKVDETVASLENII